MNTTVAARANKKLHESTPLLAFAMDDPNERRKYGALGPGRFSTEEGVLGEWQFDERRQQEPLQDATEGTDVEKADEHTRNKGEADITTDEQEPPKDSLLDMWSRFLFSKRGLGLIVLMILTIVLGVLAVVYNEEIFSALDQAATWIRDKGPAGSLILVLATCITSFPPMIGYSWCLFACGYIYGWAGFIPAYTGALLGGISSFILFRYFFRDWVEKQTRAYPKYVALERAIEGEGLPLVILIRIAPYPYPLFNALFAATRVPFHTYAIGTAVALIKVIIHISVGKSISSFSDILKGTSGPRWDLIFLIAGAAIGIGVCIYLYFRTKQYLQQYADHIVEEASYAAAQESDAEDLQGADQHSDDVSERRPDRASTLSTDQLALLDSRLDEDEILNAAADTSTCEAPSSSTSSSSSPPTETTKEDF